MAVAHTPPSPQASSGAPANPAAHVPEHVEPTAVPAQLSQAPLASSAALGAVAQVVATAAGGKLQHHVASNFALLMKCTCPDVMGAMVCIFK